MKIHGFSYASAWLEKFKTAQKKTTQKSKGIQDFNTTEVKASAKDLTSSSSSESDNSDKD